MSLGPEQARSLAEEELAKMKHDDLELRILDVQEHVFGWVFFYQSEAFVRTGDPSQGVGGNAPLIVTRDGALHHTGTAEPAARYIERFIRWGDPHIDGDPTCIRCQRDPELSSLCPYCASELAEHPGKLRALKSLRDDVPGLGIHLGLRTIEAAGLFPPPPLVEPTVDELLGKVQTVRGGVLAVEAVWDGDTDGWGVSMCAVTEDEEVSLAWLRHPAGDLRVLNGDFTKPEAEMAQRVGTELAKLLGVPFWFPAGDTPNDDAVRFRDRERGVPCSVCGLLLAPGSQAGAQARCFGCKA